MADSEHHGDSATQTRHSSTLAQWSLRHRYVTRAQLEDCLAQQGEARKAGLPVPRLSELLVARRLLTPEQVARAFRERSVGTSTTLPLSAAEEAEERHAAELPLPEEVALARANPANRFGKYVLLRELGKGAVGLVYLAWDTYLEQRVALKRIRPPLSYEPRDFYESRVQSLMREARNAIRLRHPSIVSIFDVGRINGEYFISMEYIEGETLQEWNESARKRGKVSPYFENPRALLRFLAETARAVHYAHSRPVPIIHCDLKPGNIIVDAHLVPHVLDFCLARTLTPKDPDEESVAGTPSYMAPEQASGRTSEIDGRTDVYALGAMLYELLAGRPPFVGEIVEVLTRTIRDKPDSPSDILSPRTGGTDDISTRRLLLIPAFLEALCMRCLEKDRERRPSDLLEVAEILERGDLAAMTTLPPPPAAVAPPPPAARSRLVRPVAVAAVLLALAAAAGLALRGPSTAGDPPPLERHLRDFRPDLALAEGLRRIDARRGDPSAAPAAMAVEEARWVGRAKEGFLRRLSSAPLDCPELRLRTRLLRGALLRNGDDAVLRVVVDGAALEIPWGDVDPAQLARLLRDSLQEPAGEERLGLGIYALRAGLPAEARECFLALRGGLLGNVAERYLSLLGP